MPVFTFTNATLTLTTRRTSPFRCAARRMSYLDGDALRFGKYSLKRANRHRHRYCLGFHTLPIFKFLLHAA